MMQSWNKTGPRRWTALAVATGFLLPTVAGCGQQSTDNSSGGGSVPPPAAAPAPPPAHQGLTGKQKVVLLAGAALLYYLYKRDEANNNKPAATGPGGRPQLYREEKGAEQGRHLLSRSEKPAARDLGVRAHSAGRRAGRPIAAIRARLPAV